MPVPSNISFGTAIDVGSSFPYSNTQQIDDSGTYYTVYYKITATATEVLGFFFFGSLADYTATVTVYESDQTTIYLDFTPIGNRAFQMPVAIGATYYFEVVADGTLAVSPANLAVSVVSHTDVAVVAGDLLIPDDTAGLPATINDATSGNVNEFQIGVAACEQGVALSNGYSAVIALSDEETKIYNSSFTQTQSLALYTGQDLANKGRMGSNKVDTFYIGNWDSPNAVQRVLYDGTLVTPELTPLDAGSQFFGLDPNNGETILYYNMAGGAIKRWDIVNNVALSNLVAALATYVAGDIKVLADDTILVMYTKVSSTIVKQYDTSGATLNTYDFGNQSPSAARPRMDVALDNPISFWVFMHDDANTILQNVRVSDGVVLTSINVVSYESGTYAGALTASPTARFGASGSCPLMTLLSSPSPPPDIDGALYVQTGTGNVPAITFDELFSGTSTTTTVNTAIPSPTVIIYPAGD